MDKIATLCFLLAVGAVVVLPNFVFGRDVAKPCSQRDHLKIASLSIYPDPLPDSSRVEEWRLRLRSDGKEACQIPIRIVEVERDVVVAESAAVVEAGANEITLAPAPDYRFATDTRCFVVVASTDRKIQIEGPKAFCALHIDNWWTMR